MHVYVQVAAMVMESESEDEDEEEEVEDDGASSYEGEEGGYELNITYNEEEEEKEEEEGDDRCIDGVVQCPLDSYEASPAVDSGPDSDDEDTKVHPIPSII